MAKSIPVGKYFAIVDDDDYDRLIVRRWAPFKSKDSRNTVYAISSGGAGRELMHKAITGFEQTDHVNGNGLDNRRDNLRPANHSQNAMNRAKDRHWRGQKTLSKFKGVSRDSRSGSWYARITVDKVMIRLGYFSTEIEAAKAYDSAALKHFGEFAHINFPAL